ncbi:MAG: hypothetical protein HUK21_11180 [Fibrobacteraceae bacterium]|nr:hypothetical protein [Fibrobacteraceae bacterium]
MSEVYYERPNLYIGFHGCDKKRGLKLIEKPYTIPQSTHDYEWLGYGFYVWENNKDRALDWAQSHHPKFEEPFVIGVVYTLGNCLDLTDQHFIELLSEDFPMFIEDFKSSKSELPQNTDLKGNPDPEGVLRKLDCALIEHLHSIFESAGNNNRFDTVRCSFTEGKPAYPGTAIRDKNHIQVCIRNTDCIKGFFLPRT